MKSARRSVCTASCRPPLRRSKRKSRAPTRPTKRSPRRSRSIASFARFKIAKRSSSARSWARTSKRCSPSSTRRPSVKPRRATPRSTSSRAVSRFRPTRSRVPTRKRPFAQPAGRARPKTLTETIRFAKATVLVGLSGQPRAFDAGVVGAILESTPRPIVFRLSNPNASCEVVARAIEDGVAWIDRCAKEDIGALVAARFWNARYV
jgi:hypothetical protein